MITYEAACDPEQNSCFVGCYDNECADTYFYAKILKYEPYIQSQCGENITNCQQANKCANDDKGTCSIEYCSSNEDTCSKQSSI